MIIRRKAKTNEFTWWAATEGEAHDHKGSYFLTPSGEVFLATVEGYVDISTGEIKKSLPKVWEINAVEFVWEDDSY